MSDLKLYPMKEIRIIIEGEQLKFATDLLDNKATGYTVVHNISGKAITDFTVHTMFNEMDSIVMLIYCRGAGKRGADPRPASSLCLRATPELCLFRCSCQTR